MSEVMLTFYCLRVDSALIARTLRDASREPVHVRAETVYGLDFSDATTAESVSGQLDRVAIEVRVPAADAEALVARVDALKRAAPVRWHSTAVLAGGRLS